MESFLFLPLLLLLPVWIPPDRPFHNLGAPKSVRRRPLNPWKWLISWSWGLNIVKGSVGSVAWAQCIMTRETEASTGINRSNCGRHKPSDRLFHDYRALRSGDRRHLCSSWTSCDGFGCSKIVRGSVGHSHCCCCCCCCFQYCCYCAAAADGRTCACSSTQPVEKKEDHCWSQLATRTEMAITRQSFYDWLVILRKLAT